MPVSESQETAKTKESLLLCFCLFPIQNAVTAADDVRTKSDQTFPIGNSCLSVLQARSERRTSLEIKSRSTINSDYPD